MNNWVLFTFIHAVFAGIFQTSNKKAREYSSVLEILGVFSLISLMLTFFISKNVFDIQTFYLFLVFIKSSVIVGALLLNLYAVKNISLSKYGIIHLSRVIFSVLLSVIILKEKLTPSIMIGIVIVIFGLYMVNSVSKDEKKVSSFKYEIMLLISCFLNSISAILDKSLSQHLTNSQLQFWYILFITLIYWVIILIRKQDINFKKVRKNYWIPIMAFTLIIGDKVLFIANGIPESQVSVMTVIKQFSTIETIILGKLLYNEKNIVKKVLWSLLIILGIIFTII